MRATASLVIVAALWATVTPASAQSRIEGCELFPPDDVWNAPVDELPVHPDSDDYVASIGAGTGLHPDFGSGLWEGGPIGIPFVTVGSETPDATVLFFWADESDPSPYPIPSDAPIEGGSDSGGDRHVLVLDSETCVLSETFDTWPPGELPDAWCDDPTAWCAWSGAVFDLGSHALRPDGWTSADAAGLPILPGLVRYDEVASGEIRHALRFTAAVTRDDHVWPARHDAGSTSDPGVPAMGQRFRLRADYHLSGFSEEARVILQAMKTYGLVLADNGSDWYVSGVPDERWDNDVLHEIDVVVGSDFEAVDVSSLIVHTDSGETTFVFGDGFESGGVGWWNAVVP